MSLVGNRIKEARIGKGWSQEELASKIGTTKATISRYEKGLREPRIDTLCALADKSVLDVSIGYLQGYESKDAEKIVDALKKSDMRTVENLMGLPEGSILPLSDEDRTEIEDQLQKKQHNSETNINKLKFFLKIHYSEFTEQDYCSLRSMIEKFSALNYDGQQKAIERVEELSEIPKYQKEKAPSEGE